MATSSNSRNAYSVLGLHKGASDEQIKRAYVSLVKKYDPERHTNRFMVIQDAFDRLKDPQKRAREDIHTFNHIQVENLFSKEERVDAPDEKLNSLIAQFEEKVNNNPEPLAEDREKLIRGYLIRAYKNVSRKLIKEAMDDWMRVLEIDPTHHRAKNNLMCGYIKLGFSYANHKLYDEAIELWEKSIQMNPDDELTIHNLALACERSEHRDEAKRYWDETLRRWDQQLKRNPDDEYLKNVIVEARRHQADWDSIAPPSAPKKSAVVAPAARGRTRPQPPPSQKAAAPAPANQTSHEAPSANNLQQCREILKLKPDDLEANMKLSELLMEQKQWKEATSHLRGIQKKFPKKIEIINRLGWSLLNSQEVAPAFQIWGRGLKLDPNNFEVRESITKAHLMVGRGLRDKKLFINALVHFKALAKYRPDDDNVHFELGLTYQLKGDPRSAFKEYKKAIKLNPKHKQARQNLSDLKIHR